MRWRIIICVQFISALECLEFYKHLIWFHGLKHGLFGFSLFVLPLFFIATTDKTQIKLSASYPQSNKKQANHS